MNPFLSQYQMYSHQVRNYARACFDREAEQGSEPPRFDPPTFPEPPKVDLESGRYRREMEYVWLRADLELERYRRELEYARVRADLELGVAMALAQVESDRARLEMEMSLAQARLECSQGLLAWFAPPPPAD